MRIIVLGSGSNAAVSQLDFSCPDYAGARVDSRLRWARSSVAAPSMETSIGGFFVDPMFLSRIFGGVVFFAALHCAGGLIGGMRDATSVRDWSAVGHLKVVVVYDEGGNF